MWNMIGEISISTIRTPGRGVEDEDVMINSINNTYLISSKLPSSLFAFNATLLTTDVTLLSTAFSCFISFGNNSNGLPSAVIAVGAFAVVDNISALTPFGV